MPDKRLRDSRGHFSAQDRVASPWTMVPYWRARGRRAGPGPGYHRAPHRALVRQDPGPRQGPQVAVHPLSDEDWISKSHSRSSPSEGKGRN
jgi:hypothetical protein